jgi:transposase, IS5 family
MLCGGPNGAQEDGSGELYRGVLASRCEPDRGRCEAAAQGRRRGRRARSRRGQRSFFGYKAHIAVDHGTDLIRGAILTGADVGDSLVADALIRGDETAVYADKAYDSQARREALAEAGIADALMHRRHPRLRQPAWQKWMNVALTPIRCQVERLFGLMKRSYGYRRVRYRGLQRNRAQLLFMCMAINLRRADRLIAS